MYGHAISKSKDQPGKAANPARGQLNRENNISLSLLAPENWSRETGSAVVPSRASLLISILRLNLVLTCEFLPSSATASIYLFKPPYAIGSVPSSWVTQLRIEQSENMSDLLVHMIFLNSSNLRPVCMVMPYSKSKFQPGKAANPTRGQLNREK